MKPIKIVTSKCKRCGKQIGSSTNSMNNALGEICKDCITPQEQHQILLQQGEKIISSN